jgi:hypothetical protein
VEITGSERRNLIRLWWISWLDPPSHPTISKAT